MPSITEYFEKLAKDPQDYPATNAVIILLLYLTAAVFIILLGH
jgi:hypothetical protein